MTDTKIFLIDDLVIMRDGLKALICSHNDLVVVGEATDGAEAVKITSQLHPDMVIIGIDSLNINGLDVILRIKERQPDVKILILTQRDNQESPYLYVKAGVTGYLSKEAAGSDLISAIYAVKKGELFLDSSATKQLMNQLLNESQTVDPFESLSIEEKEMLAFMASGKKIREIAGDLSLSENKIARRRNRLMHKLDLHNQQELVRYAIRKDLIK